MDYTGRCFLTPWIQQVVTIKSIIMYIELPILWFRCQASSSLEKSNIASSGETLSNGNSIVLNSFLVFLVTILACESVAQTCPINTHDCKHLFGKYHFLEGTRKLLKSILRKMDPIPLIINYVILWMYCMLFLFSGISTAMNSLIPESK